MLATAAITKPSAKRNLPESPAVVWRLTLAQSSARPIRPKATVTPKTIQTKPLSSRAQSNVDSVSAARISKPPIVGVPALVAM